MSADYTLPPVPGHPDWQVDQCNWLERERDVIASYGHAVAAPLLARIAELEGSHSEFADARRAWLASDAIKQSAIDRLCAEVEALRSCLSEHLSAAVACQNSVVKTRGTDGMDRLSFANDKARALLAQPSTSWVNPLAAEVDLLRGVLRESIIEWEPGRSYTAAELLRRAIRGLRVRKGRPVWPAVMNLFGVGSNVGHHLCRWAGRDPETGQEIAARKGEGSQP